MSPIPMSNRPIPRPYNRAERYEELTGLRDTMVKIIKEMDPSDPLCLRAIERLVIAENMVTIHVFEHLLEDLDTKA